VQWSLNGPDKEWFSLDDLVAYFGMSRKTIRKLIAEGRFPRGIRPSPRTPERWSGLDVAAYLYLQGRAQVGPAEEPEDSEEE
jgi:predicted DNA-binding transcriptional regulator AlpA